VEAKGLCSAARRGRQSKEFTRNLQVGRSRLQRPAAIRFNCREQGVMDNLSLTRRRALFPDRSIEILLHRETDSDLVMGARKARIQPDGFIIFAKGLVQLALLEQDVSVIIV
jgi:hypothetical protein